ncbi:MAG: small acid-soluble spore protein Tlp [Clostridiaceae bacterium]|nr:small acid-soluble spore protein Tlp [Clostridiaceae bacterium]
MGRKPKPDDRRDNVEKIQENINNTIENIEAAEDMLAKTDNPEQRHQIEEKNERRRKALEGMREEIRDEALARERGYK